MQPIVSIITQLCWEKCAMLIQKVIPQIENATTLHISKHPYCNCFAITIVICNTIFDNLKLTITIVCNKQVIVYTFVPKNQSKHSSHCCLVGGLWAVAIDALLRGG